MKMLLSLIKYDAGVEHEDDDDGCYGKEVI